jgi:hypothetical protein
VFCAVVLFRICVQTLSVQVVALQPARVAAVVPSGRNRV